jgi:hypothetical protein
MRRVEILVMYHNGTLDFVQAPLLTHLLAIGKIKQFLRGDSWAVVGVHPVRIREQSGYIGLERRRDRRLSPKIRYV